MEGRKIHPDLENPLDNLLLALAEALCPAFKALGHTPNMITTYSLITGLASVWALYHGHIAWFAGLFGTSYFFDCLDGHYARKYDMVTKFGDMYDHIKDVAWHSLVFLVVFIRYGSRITRWDVAVMVAAVALTLVHLGCQETHYTGEDSVLTLLTAGCPAPGAIAWTRWVGCGTMHLLVVVMVWSLHTR